MNFPVITVSIVNHGHDFMLRHLLGQLAKHSTFIAKVIVTHNIPNEDEVIEDNYPFDVAILQNNKPLGFGANHNQAFQYCETQYFCVMNPDINIKSEPFGALLFCFENPKIGIVAPTIITPEGEQEDSARYFPTPLGLIRKLLTDYDGSFPAGHDTTQIFPDWVGGMFLVFPSVIYKELSGFDEGYFLYYEDVDICARCWRSGNKVVLVRNIAVIHDARRTSHTNLKYLKWHMLSALRFFLKHLGRFPKKLI
jgi:hypothetical protein